jgi:acyl-CoA synthetase (AMP-forming)/AMP-acid ligase II
MVFREREMRNLFEFCETDAVVVPGDVGKFDHAGAVRTMRGELPKLRQMIVVGGSAQSDSEITLEDLRARGAAELGRLAELKSDPDAVYFMNFTSGTEGDPKGFMHTHNSLISFVKLMMVDPVVGAMPDAVVLTCSPLTHSFGHAITYYTAIGGLKVVLVNKYRPLDVLQLIDREKVNFIAGTPAHLVGVIQHPDFAKYDTSSIKSVMVGGARSAPEFIEMLERTWGITPNNSYGLGENGIHTRTTAADPPEKRRDTVGKLIPGAELRIVDPDDRASDRPVGEVGEIAFRGPALFVGYYRQPDLTAGTRDADGWFFTGDLGFVDSDDYLHFVSRKSEVINRGGTKIYPKEIEDLLYLHPKVADAAVVGMPDFRLGERVCAYVVARDGQEITLEEIAEFLDSQQVTKHKLPERLIILDELPMTPTGKVRKAELQDDINERVRAETGTE